MHSNMYKRGFYDGLVKQGFGEQAQQWAKDLWARETKPWTGGVNPDVVEAMRNAAYDPDTLAFMGKAPHDPIPYSDESLGNVVGGFGGLAGGFQGGKLGLGAGVGLGLLHGVSQYGDEDEEGNKKGIGNVLKKTVGYGTLAAVLAAIAGGYKGFQHNKEVYGPDMSNIAMDYARNKAGARPGMDGPQQ